MITHEIQIVIPDEPRQRSYSHWPYMGQQQQRPREMTKYEYAQYIEGVKRTVKIGDIVIGNYDSGTRLYPTTELPKHRFFCVLDIQEIHSVVKYVGGRPECLYLRNLNVPYGGSGYWTAPDSYDVVPYDELPPEVKKYVDARDTSSQADAH